MFHYSSPVEAHCHPDWTHLSTLQLVSPVALNNIVDILALCVFTFQHSEVELEIESLLKSVLCQ